MFAAETRLDEKDAFLHQQVGRWIVLTWRGDLFQPPKGQAFGTHLATFVLCPFGTEIRALNYRWLYTDSTGRRTSVGRALEGIDGTWFFKYQTLKKFEGAVLTPEDVATFELPDLNPSLHDDLTAEVLEIRRDASLAPFRHPGFLDDVWAFCDEHDDHPESEVKNLGSYVWVRLTGKGSRSTFIGSLLNQPATRGYRKGDSVTVAFKETSSTPMLVCSLNPL